MNIVHDKLGNIIRPGDLVACAVSRYRSAVLKLGVVMEITGANSVKVKRVSNPNNSRAATLSGREMVVLRWDTVREENDLNKYLQELKMQVVAQMGP